MYVEFILTSNEPIVFLNDIYILSHVILELASLPKEEQELLAAKIFVNTNASTYNRFVETVETLVYENNIHYGSPIFDYFGGIYKSLFSCKDTSLLDNSFVNLLFNFFNVINQNLFLYHDNPSNILNFILDSDYQLSSFCSEHPYFTNLLITNKSLELVNKLVVDTPINKQKKVLEAINRIFPNTDFASDLTEAFTLIPPLFKQLKGEHPEDFFINDMNFDLIKKYSTAFVIVLTGKEEQLGEMLASLDCPTILSKVNRRLAQLSNKKTKLSLCFTDILTTIKTYCPSSPKETNEEERSQSLDLSEKRTPISLVGVPQLFFQPAKKSTDEDHENDLTRTLLNFSIIDSYL